MASSLYQQLNPSYNNDMLSIVNSVRSAKNPMQLLSKYATSNNVVANVLKEVQENGGDAKSLFYKKVNQMGVNPMSILSKLQ